MEDEILRDFLIESWDNLSRLDVEFVQLEKEPGNKELLSSIFRTIHTIKGTCGFINLKRLGKVAHGAEEVLDSLRMGQIGLTSDITSIIFEAVDVIKNILNHIEATGEEPEGNDTKLINKLDLIARLAKETSSIKGTSSESIVSETIVTTIQPVVEIASETEFVQTTTAVVDCVEAKPVPMLDESQFTESLPTGIHNERSTPGDSEGIQKSTPDMSIRVRVDVLDSLMNLVGELVLSRNQLLQMVRDDEESRYASPIHHLNRITADLQEGVMKTRMQPIGNAWSKLPRLVRDLSVTVGKQIELEMIGAETELDRTVLDAIKDPLIHIVRNSADHGIESADVRRVHGKPLQGKIKLHAYHEGGHVIISIQDDGAGINRTRVLEKAIQNGIVSSNDAKRLSDNEILSFIFHPGFSTAKTVSSVSGRGVGMDVVKTAIERIGGTVELQSIETKGTTIRIKIPLTLAIISALIIESGGLNFAIPQLGIVELVRLPREESSKLEQIANHQVLRLRDRLLPIVYLTDALGLSRVQKEDQDINIVVVQVGDEQMGLIVSEVFDTEEIVVKPVGRLLKEITLYQGTTILGNGQVIMILDVMGIASLYGNFASSSQLRGDFELANQETREKTTLLIFRIGQDQLMAVPLALVSRLEELASHRVEKCGERYVIQYRNSLLPLVSSYEQSDRAPISSQMIIVFSEGSRSMGLLVDEIMDIVEEPLEIHVESSQPGVMGSTILGGKAINLLDTYYYITQSQPDWYQKRTPQQRSRILVVDQSLFFRQLLTTTLESKKYAVSSVATPSDALEKLEHGYRCDLIISDLSFDSETGLELIDALRENATFSELPVMIMADPQNQDRRTEVMAAGAHSFAIKFNARTLLEEVSGLLGRKVTRCLEVSSC